MKFFICKDDSKFGIHDYEQYGEWYWYSDDQVKVYENTNYIILYCGYLIEGDMFEACRNLSFNEENGNFFAVKLTPDGEYEIFLDYFNNHKVFWAEKYGIEISNWLPFMTCNQSDIVRDALNYDYLARELTSEENTTFFGHINSYVPPYNYMLDAKQAWETEKWDPTKTDCLAEYIHECMTGHAKIIKRLYSKRFISLSEGIDSLLQSLHFREDTQYGYHVEPSDAGEDALKWKQIQWNRFPKVETYDFIVDKSEEYVNNYMVDSTSRWASILPTMVQVAEAKPDIVMYGVNGDEMFFRDLTPHLHAITLKNLEKCETVEELIDTLKEDVASKVGMYGCKYSVGDDDCADQWVDIYVNAWLRSMPGWRNQQAMKNEMFRLMTPKYYTRSISANNDVMCASLYNDRRIYHEVLKSKQDFLLNEAMDTPIQRMLVEKFDIEFDTPHKDVLSADYDPLFSHIFEGTVTHCLEDNI